MNRARCLLVTVASCFAANFAVADPEPALEDFLNAPFLSSVVGAPSANRFVWITQHQGRRNLWLAEGPDYRARALTHYDRDDGQEISNVSINDDGTVIAFVRGGAPTKEGTSPNPTSDPKGAKREVWIATLHQAAHRVGEGHSAALEPDGKSIVFARANQLYWSSVQSSAKPKELLKARGELGKLQWSPDGARIAFVSSRGEGRYSFVGVYDRNSKQITWMSPSVDRDVEPTWSPDGKRLAFIRLEVRSAEPSWGREPDLHFSLWITDPATGAGQAIWTSTDETGGFAQLHSQPALLWTAGNRLLFFWEKDGWMRIYSLARSGGNAVALTPPNCEAGSAAVSPNGSELLFTSNCEDIDRRHVWSVPVAGGPARRLISDGSLQWNATFIDSGRRVAFLQATAQSPAQPAIWSADQGSPGRLVGLNFAKPYPTEALVEPKAVEFKSEDGTLVHGQLFLPRGLAEGNRRPALLYIHGGPIRQMLLGWHYLEYYHQGYAMNQFMASRGYVTLSVNYRTGTGYGRSFRRIPTSGPNGATEYQDIVAAGKYLQERPEVDPTKIGLWGGSYGGYLTAMGLARDSELFAAGVDFHGVHDWNRQIKNPYQVGSPLDRDAALTTALASSPIAKLRRWTSPVLFIHGDDDQSVDFVHTSELIHRLRSEKRAHVENLVFPDEAHSFLRQETWRRAFQATADFFDRFLSKPNHATK